MVKQRLAEELRNTVNREKANAVVAGTSSTAKTRCPIAQTGRTGRYHPTAITPDI
jgi:hypothetical protein